MAQLVGGLDGCRDGWVSVTAPASGDGESRVEVVHDLIGVIACLDDGLLAAAGIDIPIGLPASGPRPCDIEARKLIVARRSSVFPAPVRAAIGAESYEAASEASKAISGKGLSKQAFAIFPKIREVDDLMTPARQQSFFEVHPEVCFTVLADKPMSFHKSKPEGRAERLEALRTVFPDIDEHANVRLPGTQPDDVLDAFVAAWSARRWVSKSYMQLGGELDERGLRMEMIA